MPRIQPVDSANALESTWNLLRGVESKLGMLPNTISTMAQSPATLRAYLGFSQALASGVIPSRLREQIALTVSQANECVYCLAAHSAIGNSLGLSQDDLADARLASSTNRKTEAALQFARRIVDQRGEISDEDFDAIRGAGYDASEVAEIIAHVSLITFTNYFNKATQTEIDFPPVLEIVNS